MSSNQDNTNSRNDSLEQVRELTWALIDDQISSDEKALLNSLLLSSNEARNTYAACIELHANLAAHFAAEPAAQKPATQTTSPILGFLNSGLAPVNFQANS